MSEEKPPPLSRSRRGAKVITTIRIPEATAMRLARYAMTNGATQGEAIRHLLDWALERAGA